MQHFGRIVQAGENKHTNEGSASEHLPHGFLISPAPDCKSTPPVGWPDRVVADD